MKIEYCDICEKPDSKISITLYEHYRVDGIKELCRKCDTALINEIHRIKDQTQKEIITPTIQGWLKARKRSSK